MTTINLSKGIDLYKYQLAAIGINLTKGIDIYKYKK